MRITIIVCRWFKDTLSIGILYHQFSEWQNFQTVYFFRACIFRKKVSSGYYAMFRLEASQRVSKMSRVLILVVFTILQSLVESKQLPSYIIPCRRNDPNLNACAKQHAIDSLPSILKGDRTYKIPSFLPVQIPLVDVQQGNDMKFKLKDLKMYGLNTTHIEDLIFDLDKKHFYVRIFIDETVTESRYEVDGKLLTLAIKGEGPAKIQSNNVTVEYSFDYELIKKADGKQYFDLDNLKTNTICKVGHTHYYFGNLFGGNKALGDNFNQILNENEKELEGTAEASNNEIINAIVSSIFSSFFKIVSYDEMFLD